MITKLIVLLCSLQYKKYGKPIFYIKGNGKDEGIYLLYTQRKDIAKRMDDF